MDTLVFVYNADSGLSNALLDTGRRIFQPKNYPCALCMITYGPFGMKQDWKTFVMTLPHPVVFMHKNEFHAAYPAVALAEPGLLKVSKSQIITLLDRDDFQNIQSLKQLKESVNIAIEKQP